MTNSCVCAFVQVIDITDSSRCTDVTGGTLVQSEAVSFNWTSPGMCKPVAHPSNSKFIRRELTSMFEKLSRVRPKWSIVSSPYVDRSINTLTVDELCEWIISTGKQENRKTKNNKRRKKESWKDGIRVGHNRKRATLLLQSATPTREWSSKLIEEFDQSHLFKPSRGGVSTET